ncbi:hypothetical protein HID58_011555 [Brassica napus]|uniref:Cytochrome P450 n=1 Tax=Brassica napus TaxID=3708 RepID=A0ABQ8DYL2_BRANA|nr:hypothetical protein HID58_011555 [Brassica napus]
MTMVATIIVDFQYCFIFILLCFSSLLCYTLFFRKPKDSCVDFPLPPSPPSLPIIGHLHLLLSIFTESLLQIWIYSLSPHLHFPIVLVSSASVAYEIFRAHDVNISSRASSLLPMEITGIVTKLLGPQALERSRRVRGDELDRFYNNLFDKAVKKESVEICEEALKLTINSICKLIMGRCCLEEGGVAERVKRLANELDVMTRKILLANMLPPWLKKLVLSLFKKEVMVVSNRKPKDFDLPPSPPSLPIIGHLHLLLSALIHRSLQKLSSKYGSLLYLRIFSSPIVLVSSASVAYEIFRAHDVNISSRGFPPTGASLFAGSFSFISAPYGEYMKFMKKVLVTNLLGPQALKRSRRVRADELDRFYDNLFEKAAKKETVEIFEEVLKLVNDSICKLIMGRCCPEEEDVVERVKGLAIELDVSSKKILLANLLPPWLKKLVLSLFKKEVKAISNSFDELLEKILAEHEEKQGENHQEEEDVVERVKGLAIELDVSSKKILLANLLPPWLKKLVLSLFKKEVKAISNSFDELLEKILAEHEEKQGENHQGKDLMDVLLAAYGEYKITTNHIKSFYVDLLFAGVTNSALPIQWTLAEIINSPNSLERLRVELDSVVGTTRLIQETDLPNLPYLQAVVKEGLRLHPPEPMFERFSQEGCRVGGFYVPEKTSIMVNAYAMMRDPNYWADPDEFKPERFLVTWQEEERRGQALKYIPFGSGRRGCPGENLAHIFIGTAIGVMVQGFEWRFKEEKVKMEEAVAGLSLTMAHPLKCTPVARTLNPLTSRGSF